VAAIAAGLGRMKPRQHPLREARGPYPRSGLSGFSHQTASTKAVGHGLDTLPLKARGLWCLCFQMGSNQYQVC